MGLTFNLGRDSAALTSDASLNVGIGGSPSGSYKLEVTGSDILVNGIRIGKGAGSIASNTAIGLSALSANTTGTYNTAIGNLSLQTNTTGYGNTSVGYNALGYGATGFYNAAIGVNALLSNTTGTYNNALGTAALYANTTGSYNTAVGQQAGTANTTGSNNTYIGYASGFSITTGSNNTIIGYYNGTAAMANNIVLADGAGTVRYQWDGTNNAFTGAATFSSTILAGQGTFQSTGANIISKNTTTSQSNFIRYDNSVGGARAYLGYETAGTDFYIENAEGKLLLATNSGTAMTLSGLNVVIGDTAAIGNAPLGVKSTSAGQQPISSWNTATSGTIYFMEFGSGATYVARGSITYNGTITAYNSTSDYRLKEDLKEYNGLEIISKLKTYDYKWKESGVRDYGMIAHELQEILPNYVSGEKDSIDENGNIRYQGVDYSKVVPILVKAIQELSAQNQDLKSRLDKAGL